MPSDLSATITFDSKIRDSNNNLRSPLTWRNVLSGLTGEQSSAQFFVAGGSTDVALPFGSVTKPKFLAMVLSRKVTVKFDIADTGQQLGPGLVVLTSSDDGFSTSILFTTAAGEDLCVEYQLAGDNT